MSLVSSHQKLDMDGQKAGSPRFERKKGVFVERWVILLVLFLVACAIVAVGLLVGYLGPCSPTREEQASGGQVSVTTESGKVTGPSTESNGTAEKLDVRLPRSIYPEHYWVELRPYILPGNFTFDGRVEVLFVCQEDTDNVTIHYLNMTIHTETVQLTPNDNQLTSMKIGKFATDDKRQFFIIHPEEKLKANTSYKLSMNFTGILNDNLAGFYRSTYKENDQEKWLAITQFEPTDARRAFPCFDEPALKATFDITLVKWKNMSAISNMPPIKTESRDENWEAVTFDTTPRMSTYLLAFLVSQFANRTNHTEDGRTFSVWSVPAAINSTEYALDIGPRILQHYDKFFETPYPLNKTDMVAVPDFSAGAMENWGLVTFRETAMLYDKLTSSSGNKQGICKTVAHELGHQWFGDLVTPTWWDDLWLNEGFASYMEYLGCSFVEPTWGMDQQMVLDNVHTAMDLDALKSSHPIYVPVSNPAEINEIFDTISYDKGASVIRMMEKFLGNSTFTQGLKDYLQKNAYKNAASKDLWDALTNTYNSLNNGSKLDVGDVMNSWTMQIGFPVVTVTRNYDQKSAMVTQRKFSLEKTNDSAKTLWQIPLTWADSSKAPDTWDTTTKMWLKSESATIENLAESNNWVILNTQEVGYYKVNYDMQNWNMLINQLKNNHTKIHIINRAQILDDIFDLARSYDVNYTLAMNTTLYLSSETEYTPWSAALGELGYINVMLRRSDIFGKWMTYIIKLMKPNYDRLGWNEDLTKDDILTQYLRVTTISMLCSYNYPPCVETALKMFNSWRANSTDETIIPPNFRGVVYCTAVQNSENASTWEFMWQQYLKEQKSGEKAKLMSALSCTRELWLLSRYLRLALNETGGIRKQDGVSVFSQVAKNNYGRDIAFNMMRDKWNLLFESYGGSSFSFGDLVKGVTSSMNTPFEAKQLTDFYKSMSEEKLGTSKRAFQQAIESVEDNVKFMNDHYQTIASWLDMQG